MNLRDLQEFIKKQTGIDFKEVPDWNGSKLTYDKAVYQGKESYIDIHIWRKGDISFWVSWKNNYSGRNESVSNEMEVVEAILKYCKPIDQQMDIFDLMEAQ